MKDRCIAAIFLTTLGLGAAIQKVHFAEGLSGKRFKKVQTQQQLAGRRRSVNFEFGGDFHGTNPGDKDGQYLTRPEAVHSLKCSSAEQCQKCDDKSACFHGETQKIQGWDATWGFQKINVAPGSAKNFHYVAEIWVRCHNPLGEWWIFSTANRIKNGRVDVYVGGRLVVKDWRPKGGGSELELKMQAVSERVEIKFYPNKNWQPSSCAVFVEVFEADEDVETCMDTKKCLKLFGEQDAHSASGYQLRNNNVLQEKCLQPNGLNAGYSLGLRQECKLWKQCLRQQGEIQALLDLMEAAMAPYGSLTQLGQTSTPAHGAAKRSSSLFVDRITGRRRKSGTSAPSPSISTCVDPSIEDPESWDCDCVGRWTTECSRRAALQPSLTTVKCLNQIMCESRHICCSWKKDHCAPRYRCASLVEKVAVEIGEAAIMKRSGSIMRQGGHPSDEVQVNDSEEKSLLEERVRLDMDSTLQAKCID